MVLFLRPSFSIWFYPLHVALVQLDYINNNACHLCQLEKSYTNLADIPFTVKKRSAMLLGNVVRTPTPLIDNFRSLYAGQPCARCQPDSFSCYLGESILALEAYRAGGDSCCTGTGRSALKRHACLSKSFSCILARISMTSYRYTHAQTKRQAQYSLTTCSTFAVPSSRGTHCTCTSTAPSCL
jgi:hypothetical protein